MVDRIEPKALQPTALEMSHIGTVVPTYCNKFFIAGCKEGVVKIFFTDTNDEGDLVVADGIVITPSSLVNLHNLIGTFINNNLRQAAQADVIDINQGKKDRE